MHILLYNYDIMKKINEKKSNLFSKNLRAIMHEQGITQMELVDKFLKKGVHIGQATISDWFQKNTLPRDSTFETLCKILHVKESDLIPDENLPLSDCQNVMEFKYPIMGSIACGVPTETFEDDGKTYVLINKNIEADYALFAHGDSMIDFGIKDGYLVFIKNYKNQAEVRNGDIAVVRVNGETTLKKFHYDSKTKTVTLIPGNSKYGPLVYSEKDITEFEVVGKAMFFQGLIK